MIKILKFLPTIEPLLILIAINSFTIQVGNHEDGSEGR